MGRLFYAAVKRFGLPVAGKISQLLASLIAAPFSGGASLALTAINIASWAYLIYDVYEWLFGDEAYEKQLEKEDVEKKNSPSQVAPEPSKVSTSDNSPAPAGSNPGSPVVTSGIGANRGNHSHAEIGRAHV